MRKKYKAVVVGLKWSPKQMSKYRPVFSYEDEYGETKQYVRRKSMERTPFSENRSYIIVKDKNGTYESTERKLSDRFCFLCLKALMLLATIIFHNEAILLLLLSSTATFAHMFLPGLIRTQIGKSKLNTEKIEGKITSYQKLKRKDDSGNPLYRPIIEYNYNGNIYTHMSKTTCLLDQYGHQSTCEIFICNSRKVVYDIFEVSQPIFDIKKWVKRFRDAKANIADKDMKVYAPSQQTPTKVFNKTDTIPINIPLKTLPYKKASGW